MAKFAKRHNFPHRPVKNTGLTQIEYGSVGIDSDGALTLPVGSEAQRPSPSGAGMTRFNTDTASLEYFDGEDWQTVRAAGYASITKDSFVTDSAVEYYGPLSATPNNVNGLLVYISGIMQEPGVNFDVVQDPDLSNPGVIGTGWYLNISGMQDGKNLVVVQGFDSI